VEPLSNLRRERDFGGDGASGAALRPARRAEIHRALQLILGHAGQLASEEQVVDFLRFAVYRGIDMNSTWVADDGRRIVWAILPVVSPGRTMLLFSPTHVPQDQKGQFICPLIETVLEHYRGGAVHLAQVLLDPTEKATIKLYQECQFEPMAELVYLEREVHRNHEHKLPAGFSWESYSPTTHEQFARTISATYESSLDCPSLNGMRTIEDVIAGHKAAGEFDAALWSLLREAEESAGVVLLNRSPRTDALEMVYIGLTPPYRGRGVGDVLMEHALATAASIGARRLTLAVDSKNKPALRLYHRHGFAKVCTRLALIRDLRDRQLRAPQAITAD
jgi:GNAT superfamily N-acetyltransferase